MQNNTITLCAIVKDESSYLLEWIAYHRLLRFDRIVVYSNDSTDSTDEMLSALDRAGVLTHHLWPSGNSKSPQIGAYMDAIAGATTDWICFIDVDEFMVLKVDRMVSEFLGRFPADISAVAMNWRVFGSAGQIERRPGLVIERFTRAAESSHHLNMHCKTLARVADVKEMHIHRCFLANGRYTDSLGRDLEIARMGFTPSVEHRAAQINHYVVKSAAEFENKQRRGNANRSVDSVDKYTGRLGEYFAKHDRNEEEDHLAAERAHEVQVEIGHLRRLVTNQETAVAQS